MTAPAASAEMAARWNLFWRNRRMVLDYVRCLVRSDSEAEDVVQEVGLRMIQHGGGPDDWSKFPAWCRGIARNVVHEHWRAIRRTPTANESAVLRLVDVAYDEADARGEGEIWNRRRDALSQCIARLKEREQELLRWRYVDGRASESLARQLGISAEAMRMRILRLRQALLLCIERRIAPEEP